MSLNETIIYSSNLTEFAQPIIETKVEVSTLAFNANMNAEIAGPMTVPIAVNPFVIPTTEFMQGGMNADNKQGISAVNVTTHLDSSVDIAHVWALWGVVIAAGLLVIIILFLIFFRGCAYCKAAMKSNRCKKKARRKLPRFRTRSGTPKPQPRPTGVMADHVNVRKDFFHSLERGDVETRRQEATRRWLSGNHGNHGNLATSLQFMDASGSGSRVDHDCIPMYETSYQHKRLEHIPEKRALPHQEYSFVLSPRPHGKHHTLHHQPQHHGHGNVNEFVRVIPVTTVRDENANISISPTYPAFSHNQQLRPRWNTGSRPVTCSRVYPYDARAVSSEPIHSRVSRRRPVTNCCRPECSGLVKRVGGVGAGAGADEGGRGGERRRGGQRSDINPRWKRRRQKLPKFNLAGEVIISSSDTSPNGPARVCDFSPRWNDWSFDNTVFEAHSPTPRLVVPANSPQTDASSSGSQESIIGESAGVTQCNVSSDGSLTVTVGTSKRTSYEWDCYDPNYNNLPIRFINGAYVPVIGNKQYWV